MGTERGIHVAGSSDAPFGDADPWLAMRAVDRAADSGGERLGPDEALSPEEALGLDLALLDDSGGPRAAGLPGALRLTSAWLMTPGVSCVASSTLRTFEPPMSGAPGRRRVRGRPGPLTFAREPVPAQDRGDVGGERSATMTTTSEETASGRVSPAC